MFDKLFLTNSVSSCDALEQFCCSVHFAMNTVLLCDYCRII